MNSNFWHNNTHNFQGMDTINNQASMFPNINFQNSMIDNQYQIDTDKKITTSHMLVAPPEQSPDNDSLNIGRLNLINMYNLQLYKSDSTVDIKIATNQYTIVNYKYFL